MEITLGPLAAIPPGEGRAFDVGSERIAVFHARDGRVFATQARCPHRDGPLIDGLLGGCTIVCPLHAQKFDVQTGEALSGGPGLRTYPVRLSATDQIVVQIERGGG
ncbi:Rieske (2Fe-2S) protein [Sorangium sp. So ce861]|uniref:Rieske (2Fe-2S) protein n=1 Tax=Sorangium sp. So ce861 TaxID=3133323 RepID=UPI003F62D2E0